MPKKLHITEHAYERAKKRVGWNRIFGAHVFIFEGTTRIK